MNHQGPDQKNTYIQQLVRKGGVISAYENWNIRESRMDKNPDLKATEERKLSADYCCLPSYLRYSYPVSFKHWGFKRAALIIV
ncbi:hypothetical protein [Cyclobacterium jeungdonense]|uniref:Uncharacterized protein n=1 Tax=Cyclobacterium jeungdonense TaxID=708087 RepID=A0ABT8C3Q2_9BACT|nr:hypothetical protein [Cyclobacterium jeungdonense]MDN3687125.1 hypothetical protein [Cyclobacterium jeungdonense]